MVNERNRFGLPVVAVALLLVASACGEDPNNPGANGNGSSLTGDIFISGSSTVEPISALVAEKFAGENPNVAINVEGPGTSDGFQLFCNGESDVQDASRAIQDEEIQACHDNGVRYVELYVAIDGLSVVTSAENDFATCLAFEDLYALLGPESQGFELWSDANGLAAELEAPNAPYPDEPLVVTAPGEESGTYDSFIELVLADIAEERGQDETTRPDYQASGNDNVIVEGIASTSSSLGWVGYAFFEQNRDVVKAIEVDGGDGCVAPTPEGISIGEYPVSRPLYVYVNVQKAADSDALRPFVDFYLTDAGIVDSVREVGYVNIPDEDVQATRSGWESEIP
jgi:phosphate transport system substrate-binding protein